MDFKQFLILIVLVLLTFTHSNSALTVPRANNPPLQSRADFEGSNLEWIYERNGNPFHLITNEASNDIPSRGRFKFIVGENENERTIQIHGTSKFLIVDGDGFLDTSSTNNTNTCFIPVPIDNNKFYLHTCAENLPLVTPMTNPPFKFYLQSRYADESPAIFRLAPYVLNVSEIYDGKLENLMKTMELIRSMEDPIIMDPAYTDLVSIMLNAGHLVGREVFDLGKYIFEDTGANSLAFRSLPQIIQTITAGGRVRLIFSHSGTENPIMMTMTSAWAYDHPNYVLPYTFTRRTDSNSWAITYGINQQLQHANNGFQLTGPTSTSLNYGFLVYLNSDLQTIEIHTRLNLGAYFSLTGRRQENGYFFMNDRKHGNATFNVIPYILNVTEMYGGLRENIIKTVDFIQKNLTDVDGNKSKGYGQLLSDMAQNGHIEGKQIFELGQYILEDLGNSSAIFKLLPSTVQLILNGETLSLSLEKEGEEYPVKYSWASDGHENIRPYTLTVNNGRRFAITYSEDYQWTVDLVTGKLIDVKRMEKEYVFVLYLGADLEQIQIWWWPGSGSSNNPLRTTQTQPDFYFTYYSSFGDLFSVKSFN